MGVCHQRFDWYQVSSLLVSSNQSIVFLPVRVLWVMILQTPGELSCGHSAIRPKLVECSDSWPSGTSCLLHTGYMEHCLIDQQEESLFFQISSVSEEWKSLCSQEPSMQDLCCNPVCWGAVLLTSWLGWTICNVSWNIFYRQLFELTIARFQSRCRNILELIKNFFLNTKEKSKTVWLHGIPTGDHTQIGSNIAVEWSRNRHRRIAL